MFQTAAELLEKLRQRAAAASGKLEAAQSLARTSGARPPTMWRTCSFAISLSGEIGRLVAGGRELATRAPRHPAATGWRSRRRCAPAAGRSDGS